MVVVSPDAGSVKRTRKLARALGCPFAILDKERPRPNQAEILNVIGEVKGRSGWEVLHRNSLGICVNF